MPSNYDNRYASPVVPAPQHAERAYWMGASNSPHDGIAPPEYLRHKTGQPEQKHNSSSSQRDYHQSTTQSSAYGQGGHNGSKSNRHSTYNPTSTGMQGDEDSFLRSYDGDFTPFGHLPNEKDIFSNSASSWGGGQPSNSNPNTYRNAQDLSRLTPSPPPLALPITYQPPFKPERLDPYSTFVTRQERVVTFDTLNSQPEGEDNGGFQRVVWTGPNCPNHMAPHYPDPPKQFRHLFEGSSSRRH